MILCVAAEASADRILASLLPELIALMPGHTWAGVGGPLSVKAGLTSWVDPRELTAHGLTEAISALPATMRALKRLKRALPKASALVLVDAPEINMRLLKAANARGLPVVYLAPPQAWAWRPWRAEMLKRATWVGCLFEFEAEWYRARGVEAHVIGHPLAERYTPRSLAEASSAPKWPLLFPGSRLSSFKRTLPLMVEGALEARRLHPEGFTSAFSLGLSPWLTHHSEVRALIDQGIARTAQEGVSLEVCEGDDLLSGLAQRAPLDPAPLALSHAGTMTLALGLSAVPLIGLAPLSWLSARVASALVQAPYYTLPNLILQGAHCPELPPYPHHSSPLAQAMITLAQPHQYHALHQTLSSLHDQIHVQPRSILPISIRDSIIKAMEKQDVQ